MPPPDDQAIDPNYVPPGSGWFQGTPYGTSEPKPGPRGVIDYITDTALGVLQQGAGIPASAVGATTRLPAATPEDAASRLESQRYWLDVNKQISQWKSPQGQAEEAAGGPNLFTDPVHTVVQGALGIIPYAPIMGAGPIAGPLIFGGLGVGSAANKIRELIDSKTPDELMQSPVYRQARQQGKTHEDAKIDLYNATNDLTSNLIAGGSSALGGGLATAAASRFPTKAISQMIADRISANFLGRSVVGGLEAYGGGATMVGGEEYAVQRALNQVGLGPPPDWDEIRSKANIAGLTFAPVGALGKGLFGHRPKPRAALLGEDIRTVAGAEEFGPFEPPGPHPPMGPPAPPGWGPHVGSRGEYYGPEYGPEYDVPPYGPRGMRGADLGLPPHPEETGRPMAPGDIDAELGPGYRESTPEDLGLGAAASTFDPMSQYGPSIEPRARPSRPGMPGIRRIRPEDLYGEYGPEIPLRPVPGPMTAAGAARAARRIPTIRDTDLYGEYGAPQAVMHGPWRPPGREMVPEDIGYSEYGPDIPLRPPTMGPTFGARFATAEARRRRPPEIQPEDLGASEYGWPIEPTRPVSAGGRDMVPEDVYLPGSLEADRAHANEMLDRLEILKRRRDRMASYGQTRGLKTLDAQITALRRQLMEENRAIAARRRALETGRREMVPEDIGLPPEGGPRRPPPGGGGGPPEGGGGPRGGGGGGGGPGGRFPEEPIGGLEHETPEAAPPAPAPAPAPAGPSIRVGGREVSPVLRARLMRIARALHELHDRFANAIIRGTPEEIAALRTQVDRLQEVYDKAIKHAVSMARRRPFAEEYGPEIEPQHLVSAGRREMVPGDIEEPPSAEVRAFAPPNLRDEWARFSTGDLMSAMAEARNRLRELEREWHEASDRHDTNAMNRISNEMERLEDFTEDLEYELAERNRNPRAAEQARASMLEQPVAGATGQQIMEELGITPHPAGGGPERVLPETANVEDVRRIRGTLTVPQPAAKEAPQPQVRGRSYVSPERTQVASPQRLIRAGEEVEKQPRERYTVEQARKTPGRKGRLAVKVARERAAARVAAEAEAGEGPAVEIKATRAPSIEARDAAERRRLEREEAEKTRRQREEQAEDLERAVDTRLRTLFDTTADKEAETKRVMNWVKRTAQNMKVMVDTVREYMRARAWQRVYPDMPFTDFITIEKPPEAPPPPSRRPTRERDRKRRDRREHYEIREAAAKAAALGEGMEVLSVDELNKLITEGLTPEFAEGEWKAKTKIGQRILNLEGTLDEHGEPIKIDINQLPVADQLKHFENAITEISEDKIRNLARQLRDDADARVLAAVRGYAEAIERLRISGEKPLVRFFRSNAERLPEGRRITDRRGRGDWHSRVVDLVKFRDRIDRIIGGEVNGEQILGTLDKAEERGGAKKGKDNARKRAIHQLRQLIIEFYHEERLVKEPGGVAQIGRAKKVAIKAGQEQIGRAKREAVKAGNMARAKEMDRMWDEIEAASAELAPQEIREQAEAIEDMMGRTDTDMSAEIDAEIAQANLAIFLKLDRIYNKADWSKEQYVRLLNRVYRSHLAKIAPSLQGAEADVPIRGRYPQPDYVDTETGARLPVALVDVPDAYVRAQRFLDSLNPEHWFGADTAREAYLNEIKQWLYRNEAAKRIDADRQGLISTSKQEDAERQRLSEMGQEEAERTIHGDEMVRKWQQTQRPTQQEASRFGEAFLTLPPEYQALSREFGVLISPGDMNVILSPEKRTRFIGEGIIKAHLETKPLPYRFEQQFRARQAAEAERRAGKPYKDAWGRWQITPKITTADLSIRGEPRVPGEPIPASAFQQQLNLFKRLIHGEATDTDYAERAQQLIDKVQRLHDAVSIDPALWSDPERGWRTELLERLHREMRERAGEETEHPENITPDLIQRDLDRWSDEIERIENEARFHYETANPDSRLLEYGVGNVLDPAVDGHALRQGDNLPRGAFIRKVSDILKRTELSYRESENQMVSSRAYGIGARNRTVLHFLNVTEKLLGDLDIVHLTDEQMRMAAENVGLPVDTPAFYHRPTDRIIVRQSALTAANRDRLLIHELAHPILEAADNNPRLRSIIDRLDQQRLALREAFYNQQHPQHAEVRRLLDSDEGLDNVHEFFSQLWASQDFNNALHAVKTTAEQRDAWKTGSRETLLDAVLADIKRGLTGMFFSVSKQRLLNDATISALDLLNRMETRRRPPIPIEGPEARPARAQPEPMSKREEEVWSSYRAVPMDKVFEKTEGYKGSSFAIAEDGQIHRISYDHLDHIERLLKARGIDYNRDNPFETFEKGPGARPFVHISKFSEINMASLGVEKSAELTGPQQAAYNRFLAEANKRHRAGERVYLNTDTVTLSPDQTRYTRHTPEEELNDRIDTMMDQFSQRVYNVQNMLRVAQWTKVPKNMEFHTKKMLKMFDQYRWEPDEVHHYIERARLDRPTGDFKAVVDQLEKTNDHFVELRRLQQIQREPFSPINQEKYLLKQAEEDTHRPRANRAITGSWSLQDYFAHKAGTTRSQVNKDQIAAIVKLLGPALGDARIFEVHPNRWPEVTGKLGSDPENLAFYLPKLHAIVTPADAHPATIAHESVHAGTILAMEKYPVFASALGAIAKVARGHPNWNEYVRNYEAKGIKAWETQPTYAFKDAGEFVAEFYSNSRFREYLRGIETPPELQRKLIQYGKASNLFDATVKLLTRFLNRLIGRKPTLEQVTEKVIKDILAAQAKMMKAGENRGSSDLISAARHYGGSIPARPDRGFVDDVWHGITERGREIAAHVNRAGGPTGLVMQAANFADVARMGDRGMQGHTQRVFDTAHEQENRAREIMEREDYPQIRKLMNELNVKSPGHVDDLLTYMDHENYLGASGRHALGEGDNRWVGMDRDNPGNRQLHNEWGDLNRMWNALPESSKEMVVGLRDYYKGRYDAIREAELRDLIHLKGAITDNHEGATNALIKLIGEGKDALTPEETDLLRTHAPGFDGYDRPRADRTAENNEFRDYLRTLQRIPEFRKIAGVYYPMMRRGDYVVQAYFDLARFAEPHGGTEVDRVEGRPSGHWEFPNKEGANAFIDRMSADDAPFIKLQRAYEITDDEGAPTGRWRVEVNPMFLDFLPSLYKANELRNALSTDPNIEQLYHVQSRRDYGEHMNPASATKAMNDLINSTRRTAAYINLDPTAREMLARNWQELAVRHLMSTGAKSRYLPRSFTAGASKDALSNLLQFSNTTSSRLAEREFAPRMREAIKAMDDYVRDNRYAAEPPRGTPEHDRWQEMQKWGLRRSQVQNEVHRRLRMRPDFLRARNVPKWIQYGLKLSFLDKLMSPGFLLLNGSEPWTIAAPMLAGEYGAHAYGEIAKAYSILGAGRIWWQGAADFAKVFKAGMNGDPQLADTMTLLTDKLRQTGFNDRWSSNAELMEMLQYLQKHGYLDRNAGLELEHALDPTAGRVGKFINWVDNMFRQGNVQVENVNRGVEGIAAYRLAKMKGLSHEEAMRKAQDMVDKAAGNYGWLNAPTFFNNPYAKLAFQFKKYALRMTSNLIRLFAGAIRGEPTAGRQLFAMMASQALIAGLLGWPTEIFKAPITASNALGLNPYNTDDIERILNESLAAKLGVKGKDMVLYGLPRVLGTGMGQRAGWDTMWTFGSLNANNRDGIATAIGHLAGGATLGMVTEMAQGTHDMAKGIASYLHGAHTQGVEDMTNGMQNLIPIKIFVDALPAIRDYYNGRIKPTGQPYDYQPDLGATVSRIAGIRTARDLAAQQARGAFIRQRDVYSADRTRQLQAYAQARTPAEKSAIRDFIMKQWNTGRPDVQRITFGDLQKAATAYDRKGKLSPSDLGLAITTRTRPFAPNPNVYGFQPSA